MNICGITLDGSLKFKAYVKQFIIEQRSFSSFLILKCGLKNDTKVEINGWKQGIIMKITALWR